jgi:hypothetical protein
MNPSPYGQVNKDRHNWNKKKQARDDLLATVEDLKDDIRDKPPSHGVLSQKNEVFPLWTK